MSAAAAHTHENLAEVRCPFCRRLMFRSSPDNHFPIEVRCRRCRQTVLFVDLAAITRSRGG